MNSIESANAPREVTLAGEPYTVSALTHAEWAGLTAWLVDHNRHADPVVAAFASVARAREAGVPFDDADRRAVLEAARAEARGWPPRYGTAPWFDLIQNTEGGPARFLAAVLRKHQPGVTDADVGRLSRDATPEEANTLINRALGFVAAPKAGAAPGATTPATPTADPTPTTGA